MGCGPKVIWASTGWAMPALPPRRGPSQPQPPPAPAPLAAGDDKDNAALYLRFMKKALEKGEAYIEGELARLNKMSEKAMSGEGAAPWVAWHAPDSCRCHLSRAGGCVTAWAAWHGRKLRMEASIRGIICQADLCRAARGLPPRLIANPSGV